MKIKKLLIIILIVTTIGMYPIIVKGAYQSNGDTPVTNNRDTWLSEVRKSETLGGGYGLSESLNTDLTPSSDSNNIDIHMQKNTEYGAMAILSASSYGNPNVIASGDTTTGNKTGVVIKFNIEWTAAQDTAHVSKPAVADRYMDYYLIESGKGKSGDALFETYGWHGSSSTTVTYAIGYGRYAGTAERKNWGVIRKMSGSIFSFSTYGTSQRFGTDYAWSDNQEAHPSNSYYTRSCIVNGEGI